MPTKLVWLTKISVTASSLAEASAGCSTCHVICWAPARSLLLSTPKSTCKISEKEPFALENKHTLKRYLKPEAPRNVENATRGHILPGQRKNGHQVQRVPWRCGPSLTHRLPIAEGTAGPSPGCHGGRVRQRLGSMHGVHSCRAHTCSHVPTPPPGHHTQRVCPAPRLASPLRGVAWVPAPPASTELCGRGQWHQLSERQDSGDLTVIGKPRTGKDFTDCMIHGF